MAAHYLSEIRQVQPHGPVAARRLLLRRDRRVRDGAAAARRRARRCELLAMFNGPSPAWIQQLGLVRQPAVAAQSAPARSGRPRQQKLAACRARQPWRLFAVRSRWHAGRERCEMPRASCASRCASRAAPVPEKPARGVLPRPARARPSAPTSRSPYPGDLLVFYGERSLRGSGARLGRARAQAAIQTLRGPRRAHEQPPAR